MSALIGMPIQLSGVLDYQQQAVVSKEILRNKSGTITAFAFDAGQGLSEHSAPFNAFVYIIEGQAQIKIVDDEFTANAGELIILPANKVHAVEAKQRFKMLLVMLRSTD